MEKNNSNTPPTPTLTYPELYEQLTALGLLDSLNRAAALLRCLRHAATNAESDENVISDLPFAMDGVVQEIDEAYQKVDAFQLKFDSRFHA